MSIERIVLAFAGIVIMATAALAYFMDPAWLAVTALFGANLLQSAFTGWCPMAFLLKKLRVPAGAAFA